MNVQTVPNRKIPEWIWHRERAERKSVRLSKRFFLEKEIMGRSRLLVVSGFVFIYKHLELLLFREFPRFLRNSNSRLWLFPLNRPATGEFLTDSNNSTVLFPPNAAIPLK